MICYFLICEKRWRILSIFCLIINLIIKTNIYYQLLKIINFKLYYRTLKIVFLIRNNHNIFVSLL